MLPANLATFAATVAATVLLAGCGGERRDARAPHGAFTVAVERAAFASRQHLAERAELVLTVRNTGVRTIPDLVVTVHGFTDRSGSARDADPTRDVWIVDHGPAGATTAFDDTWAAGELAPGHARTLRWEAVPAIAGTHRISYAIAPATEGPARAELRGGGAPRGTLTVRISSPPAAATVDPRTGRVVRLRPRD
jgi:hypothetical protein